MLEDTREDPGLDQSGYAIFVTPDSAFGFDGEELGDWVDMMLPIKEIYAAIHRITDRSSTGGMGDYTITDNNGFGIIQIDDLSIENIHRLAGLIEEYGLDIIESLIAFYDIGNLTTIARAADEKEGIYDSMADFAEAMYEDVNIPSGLARFIDWEAKGEEMLSDYNLIPHHGSWIIVEAYI